PSRSSKRWPRAFPSPRPTSAAFATCSPTERAASWCRAATPARSPRRLSARSCPRHVRRRRPFVASSSRNTAPPACVVTSIGSMARCTQRREDDAYLRAAERSDHGVELGVGHLRQYRDEQALAGGAFALLQRAAHAIGLRRVLVRVGDPGTHGD